MSTIKLKQLKERKIITDKVKEQILEYNEYPFLYSVCSFGFYDNYGIKLPTSITRKYWDPYEVEKTATLIRNMFKEAFGMDQVYCFKERHKPELDEYGDVKKEGRFHLNIISSPISDDAVCEPNRRCKKLFYESGRMGIPINQLTYQTIDELKIDLVNACCRQANWINKYSGSVKTQMLDDEIDLSNTIEYCLKDFMNDPKVDFTDTIIFKASDFYKP